MEHGIYRTSIHCLKSGANWGRICTLSGHTKILHPIDGNRGNFPIQRAGNLGPQGDRAEGGVALLAVEIFRLQSAVQPAVRGRLYAGGSTLHVVLGVEVGAGGVGRASGLDHGQMPLVE